MLRRRTVLEALVGGLSIALLAPARAQRSGVAVTREEPVVTRQEFDRRRPPANMPELTPPESGVCDSTFELDAGVGYSLEALSPGKVRMTVDSLRVTTRLTINIFTIAGGPAKLLAHEEGHRSINEHYYANAVAAVESAARPLIGRTFDGTGNDRESAVQSAMNRVVGVLEAAYMTRVRIRAAAANERFDEITDHGLNPIAEAEAVALAIGAEGSAKPASD